MVTDKRETAASLERTLREEDDALSARLPHCVCVEEAAATLGVGRSLAWRLVRRGELPSLRLGTRVVIPVDALHEWVARRGREQQEAARAAIAALSK